MVHSLSLSHFLSPSLSFSLFPSPASSLSLSQGYMKAMQSEDLPGILANKERLIFGNIQAVHDFHSK